MAVKMAVRYLSHTGMSTSRHKKKPQVWGFFRGGDVGTRTLDLCDVKGFGKGTSTSPKTGKSPILLGLFIGLFSTFKEFIPLFDKLLAVNMAVTDNALNLSFVLVH